jgi:PAS domain S-box-containing protein
MSTEHAAGVPGASAQGTLRILVVDDDLLDRQIVRRCLVQSEVAAVIDEAGTATEALARITPGAYDCVLLDYYMPGVEDVSLLKQLKAAAADTPIVVFTGRGDEEVAVEFMKAGAVDYLTKASLTPERVATSCRYALEIARAAAARRDMEDRLRASEAEFRTLANAIPQMAWMADADGRRYWYNDRWHEFTGLRPDESFGLGWRLVLPPEHRTRVAHAQAAAFARGESWEDTYPLRRRDDVERWFLARALPFRADGGSVRYFGTETDITERLETEQTLAAGEERLKIALAHEQLARQEAERATRARDDVLAIVAHDLRNPIQTIAVAATVLGMMAEDEKRRRHIAVIQRSAQKMERLIADLLDASSIEAGTLSIRREPVELATVVAEALEPFEEPSRARGVAIQVSVQPGLPAVSGDRDRLIQVLSNLVDNALRFTPDGQEIRVRVESRGEHVEVRVEDNGAGIAAADLPYIFDRFWQASHQSRAGAGLGLAICKGIIEAHAGEIRAESSPGAGTRLAFTVPVVEA